MAINAWVQAHLAELLAVVLFLLGLSIWFLSICNRREWEETRRAYFKKTGKRAPRDKNPMSQLQVLQEIDPDGEKTKQLEAIQNAFIKLLERDDRTPEEIRESVERKQILLKEAELDEKIGRMRKAGNPAVATHLKQLRREEQTKLRGLDDPELIREIKTYYRAKRKDVLHEGR